MDLKEKCWEGVDLTDLAQDTDKWLAVLNALLKPSGSRFQASAAV
jgi:hypothetical protein